MRDWMRGRRGKNLWGMLSSWVLKCKRRSVKAGGWALGALGCSWGSTDVMGALDKLLYGFRRQGNVAGSQEMGGGTAALQWRFGERGQSESSSSSVEQERARTQTCFCQAPYSLHWRAAAFFILPASPGKWVIMFSRPCSIKALHLSGTCSVLVHNTGGDEFAPVGCHPRRALFIQHHRCASVRRAHCC